MLFRSGRERKGRGRLGAGERTAVPAAVRQSLREMFFVDRRVDFVDVVVTPELVIVDRQKVVVVHDLVEMSRPDRAHLALYVVEVANFLVELWSL